MQKDRREGARFARNALSSYGARGLYALTLLVLTPYLYVRLGEPGFGTWAVMFTFTMVFTLVFTGFAAGLTKVLADQHAAGRREAFAASLGGFRPDPGRARHRGGRRVPARRRAAARSRRRGLRARLHGRHGGARRLDARASSRPGRTPPRCSPLQRYDLYSAGGVVSSVGFTAGAVLAVETGAGVLGVADRVRRLARPGRPGHGVAPAPRPARRPAPAARVGRRRRRACGASARSSSSPTA